MKPLTPETASIADQVLTELKEELRDAWSTRLSNADRALIEAVASDAAALAVAAMGAAWGEQARAYYESEMRQLKAQLLNIAAARELHLSETLGRGVALVIGRAASIAATGLIAAI